MSFGLLILLLVVALCSFVGTYWMGIFALRYNMLDVPNQRSSHNAPIPRGGGIALLLSFYAGGTFLVLKGLITIPHLSGLAGCALVIAAVGFLDDLYQLSPAIRFSVHCFASFVAVQFFLPCEDIFPLIGHPVPPYLLKFFLIIWLVWMLNLYNFMDGIDGLAGSEAISVALGAGIILYFFGETKDFMPLLLILAAAAYGFFVWNWPPAKIFMGDACSGFLGFCFGILALLTMLYTSLHIWAWLILLGMFVVDSTVTLAVRIFKGEKFYQAHRSHAYQILSRRAGSHLTVTLCYTGINWLILFPMACYSVYRPESAPFLVIFSYSLLTIFCMVIGAGVRND